MSHIRIDRLQRAARAGGYAVPHLLGGTTEMVIGHLRAAEALRSPLAFGFAPEVFSMVPLELALPMIVNAAERATVPVATQLEHGHDFNTIMGAIQLGVSSVMFDGSALSYEENVKQTSEITRVAHAFGVAVEGELGAVGGSAVRGAEHAKSRLTDPETVVDFVSRTGVDSLAVSFGNVHGTYQALPELDYDRVRRICSLVDVPIVMHGGSGLTAEQYRASVEAGISNIHFYTAIARRTWDEVSQNIAALRDTPVYHEVVGFTAEFFCENARVVIEMLGSAGQADAVGVAPA